MSRNDPLELSDVRFATFNTIDGGHVYNIAGDYHVLADYDPYIQSGGILVFRYKDNLLKLS